MSSQLAPDGVAPSTSLEVRGRLVDALRTDLVGPSADSDLASERLHGWIRPSTWYLTGFLIPVSTAPDSAEADDDDDLDDVPPPGGLQEELPISCVIQLLLREKPAALHVRIPKAIGVDAAIDIHFDPS